MDTFRNVIDILSVFVLPTVIIGFPLYGLYKRVPVYEEFVEGAKEGFKVAVMIIPYLVAFLFAIGMFFAIRQGVVGLKERAARRNLVMLVGGFLFLFALHLTLMLIGTGGG